MAGKLTTKQRRFVEVYDGNGTEAARLAGYTGTDAALRVTASRLLANGSIATAIQQRHAVEESRLIADRQKRQAFWTTVMQDKDEEMRTRLRASELLGRSEADFVERHEHTGAQGGPIEMSASERSLKLAGLLSIANARRDKALADGNTDAGD